MGRSLLRLAIAAGLALALVDWWATTPLGVGSSASELLTGFGTLAGYLGAVLICAQVLLIARVPWFERGAGLDRLVSWHRTLGSAVVFLVITHVAFIVFGQMALDRTGPVASYLGVFHGYPDMLTATIGTGMLLLAGLLSAGAIRRALPYELWYWVHASTYVAIFLTFLHQISAGDAFAVHPATRLIWIALYLATAAAVLWWRIVVPIARFQRHVFAVEAVVPESARMSSVWIRSRRGAFAVEPGQFLLFRFLAAGHLLTAHPYSISNVPQDGLLRITVADLGDHSRALRALRPGTRVLIEGPFGTFTAQRTRAFGVLLIAGGAGIGPIRSLAERFVRQGRDVTVVYRSRSAEDLALYGELAALPGVRLVPLVGRRVELGYDPLSPAALALAVPDAATREVFVCGPAGMTELVFDSLRALGVPVRKLHSEELSFA